MIDLTAQIELVVFSLIGILIVVLLFRVIKLLQLLSKTQEEMTREKIKEEVHKEMENSFNQFFQNFSSAIEALGTRNSVFERAVKIQTPWYRRWWFIILCIFVVVSGATFLVGQKYVIQPHPKINPSLVFPEQGKNIGEVNRVVIQFDKWIDQKKVAIQVKRDNQNIQGLIQSWNYKSVTWVPSEPITELGTYIIKVSGRQINTTAFAIKIEENE